MLPPPFSTSAQGWLRMLVMAGLVVGGAAQAAPNCSATHVERFVEFLPNFLSSKPFALQRTVLPLPLLNWTQGVDSDGHPVQGPDKTYLSAREYFQWPTLNEYMRSRELLARIATQTDRAAVLEVYQDGSTAVVSFHFRPDAGCWKLWQYEVRAS